MNRHSANCENYARVNPACTALRFLFRVTLGRTGFGDRMARIPTPERPPVMLSTLELALPAHARSLTERAALSITYGCGLHVSEIAKLEIADIDSARMLMVDGAAWIVTARNSAS